MIHTGKMEAGTHQGRSPRGRLGDTWKGKGEMDRYRIYKQAGGEYMSSTIVGFLDLIIWARGRMRQACAGY